MPMYHCVLDGKAEKHAWVAARNVEEARCEAVKLMDLSEENIGNLIVKQDDDVLDTWFSSALLPFSSFGWPSQVKRYLFENLLFICESVFFTFRFSTYC